MTVPDRAKKRILNIAWTSDDGPTEYTDKMLDIFTNTVKNKPIPVTWYIQWDRLTVKRVVFYKKLQDDRHHEIAIHGVSAVTNHIHWFPTGNTRHQSFVSIDKAILAIKAFNRYLKKNGIKAKFVRAPTGLYSELVAYLRKLGVRKNINSVTRSIIKEEILLNKKTSKVISKAVVSFSTLQSGLKKLNLHLWGGNNDGGISAQSWEAESAGKKTDRGDSLKKTFIKDLLKDKKDHSLVILCHDTTKADLIEVKRDIIMIEDYANKNNIDVVYHTMSGLYKKVTGNDA